jgi:hypothetical protein
MIFKPFNEEDVVAGRTTRVASGFWPEGLTYWSQSNFVDDFFSLTGSASTNPAVGTSQYDVRRTMYYLNVSPSEALRDDPHFSIAYGNAAGDQGSGSFTDEVDDIMASPTKAVYTQYKNLLLGTSDLDGTFSMTSGSTTITSSAIFVVHFGSYKMKDRVDEGVFEISFSGSNGNTYTFIDDSQYASQTQAVYQIITGSLENAPDSATYHGIGLFYPANGIAVFNADVLMNMLGLDTTGIGIYQSPNYPYNSSTDDLPGYTHNHKLLSESIRLANATMKVRKSEYVPARHYFIRVKNRDFNYSNNPTYVYDGTDGIHARGTIRHDDFIENPRTYVTTVGLYNDNNELVAVAKLSRPAVKSFDQELLIRVRLDF